MGRFVEGSDRWQASLLPASLEDYVDADNPVRVIDAFVDELDLVALGFGRAQPAQTGRPGYHPATLLKLYVYGYVHQVSSSRRLEREAGRNVELMWLVGRLVPDFKTIADFRRDNTAAIKAACQRFVAVCRLLGLVGGATVAVDGSKFRAVNTHAKNFTKGKLARRKARVEESIARWMAELEAADSDEDGAASAKVGRLAERLAALRGQLSKLEAIEERLATAPDGQLSLTDPDARAMATANNRTGVVGYNVQAAVDTAHHLVVAHEVTNTGHDRSHLLPMAMAAKAETEAEAITVLADRGYFEGEQIRGCEAAGIVPLVPKPDTSPAKARGLWGKDAFVHDPKSDSYICPMGQRLTNRFVTTDRGKTVHIYANASACSACGARAQCTSGTEKRIRRWEHEAVLDRMQARLDASPDAMTTRRSTVEHVFATLKGWMGATHFRTRGLPNVSAETSLAILAYNMKRAVAVAGVAPLLRAIQG